MDVIARQCGTSAAMIEQHYSHVKPEMFADALSGVTFDEEKPKPKSKNALARQERSKGRAERMFKDWTAEYQNRGCI